MLGSVTRWLAPALIIVLTGLAGGVRAAAVLTLVLSALYEVYSHSSTVQRLASRAGRRLRKELKEPHPLTPVLASLAGTILIVHFGSIWSAAKDVVDPPSAAEKALARKVGWLEGTINDQNAFSPPESRNAFSASHERYDLDLLHSHHASQKVDVGELLDHKYEFLDSETTVVGDVANVEDYGEGVIGLWLADPDEQRGAEAICAVKVRQPAAFIEDRRVEVEALPLVFGTRNSGTAYSKATVGLACARADIRSRDSWTPQELVDDYIDDLQNRAHWEHTFDRARIYWIDHYDELRLDRAHPYLSRGVRGATVDRVVWAVNAFSGRPVLTWGWVVSTQDSPVTIDGKHFVRQLITVEDEDQPSSEVACDVLRPRERPIRDEEWVNAIGIVIGEETVPNSDGGFSNTARMVCSSVIPAG